MPSKGHLEVILILPISTSHTSHLILVSDGNILVSDRMHLTKGRGKIQKIYLSNAVLKIMNNITRKQSLINYNKPLENSSFILSKSPSLNLS